MGNFIFCALLTKDFGDRLRLARNFLNLLSKYVFLKVSKTLILGLLGFTWGCSTWVYNLGQKIVEKFTKLSKIGLSMACLTNHFCNHLAAILRFVFWEAAWLLAIISKHFRDFLEIF